MATLLSAVTSNGAGTGAEHSGPCTIWVRGVMDGAEVVVQGADENVSGSFVKLDRSIIPEARFDGSRGSCVCNATGTYYLRAVVSNAGSATSITVVTTQ
jgi:hypothetical protein